METGAPQPEQDSRLFPTNSLVPSSKLPSYRHKFGQQPYHGSATFEPLKHF